MSKKETITMEDVDNEINEVRKKHFTIINYILNKSDGEDYDKLMEDLEEFEDYLADSIRF